MNNEAPEIIGISLTSLNRGQGQIYKGKDIEAGDVRYRRVDPPAAPKCVECEHELWEDCPLDGLGQCQVRLTTPGGDANQCGCKCRFVSTPAAPDERDRREVLKVINAKILASHNLDADPENFVINQSSLCDGLLSLLATVRTEEREAALNSAINQIHCVSFIGARHCSVEFLSGANWARDEIAKAVITVLGSTRTGAEIVKTECDKWLDTQTDAQLDDHSQSSLANEAWKQGAAHAAQQILNHLEPIDTVRVAARGSAAAATAIGRARVTADAFVRTIQEQKS